MRTIINTVNFDQKENS